MNYVLIPIHNAELTLERSIESVLIQNFNQDFEVCAVLNNCADKSEEILKNISKNSNKKINILYENESGIVPALNTGLGFICNNKFDIVFRQDADDIWYQNKMQKQFDYLQNCDTDILGTQMAICKKDSFEFGIREQECLTNYPTDRLNCAKWLFFGKNPIGHPSVAIKSKVFKSIFYRKNYPFAEDLKFWSEAVAKGYNLENLDEVLIDYNFRSNPNYNPAVISVIVNELKTDLHF